MPIVVLAAAEAPELVAQIAIAVVLIAITPVLYDLAVRIGTRIWGRSEHPVAETP